MSAEDCGNWLSSDWSTMELGASNEVRHWNGFYSGKDDQIPTALKMLVRRTSLDPVTSSRQLRHFFMATISSWVSEKDSSSFANRDNKYLHRTRGARAGKQCSSLPTPYRSATLLRLKALVLVCLHGDEMVGVVAVFRSGLRSSSSSL